MGPRDLLNQLRRDALEGLTGSPKSIPSKWFYDQQGSQLFDQITRLPEYYLTRCESRILGDRAATIAKVTGAASLIELGSGLSEKTRILLEAFGGLGALPRFYPFDVDKDTLLLAAAELLIRYPELKVQGIAGDFERHLDAITVPGRSLVVFLGSTIGNLDPAQRGSLLGRLRAALKPGDWLLLGVDLVKDVAALEAAYNDSAGVSAAFNLNILSVLNRRLSGNFRPARFEHVARWDPESEQMRMALRSTEHCRVQLHALDLEVEFAAGEPLHTEISAKFRRPGIEKELEDAGLEPRRWWTDPAGLFALSLSTKP